MPGCLLKLTGTHAGPAFERPGKITLVGKPRHECDLRLGVFAFFKITFCQESAGRFQDVPITRALRTQLPLQRALAPMQAGCKFGLVDAVQVNTACIDISSHCPLAVTASGVLPGVGVIVGMLASSGSSGSSVKGSRSRYCTMRS